MKTEETPQAEIGLIGLAVMGENLALNMADHGFPVAIYNRSPEKTDRILHENPETPGGLVGCASLTGFVAALNRPRKIVLMVKAGKPVDEVTRHLVPLLEPGDVIIDGGNSLWTDTIRREKELKAKDLLFVGSGVSGGEEGARFGPSLMPGGTKEAWNIIAPVWKAIAAKVDPTTGKPLEGATPGKPVQGGEPCAAYIGENGAGHFVKMVHNGIEYGDMQMICEAYYVLKHLLRVAPPELSEIFAEWNEGDLDSFLIEITRDILKQKDPDHPDRYLVDSILDTAGQKGTGKWTSGAALDLGVPAPTIAEAVFSRFVSALKEERTSAAEKLHGPTPTYNGGKVELITAVRDALYASKICSYAQGFALMTQAQKEYDWDLRFEEIAKIWRGGCIIRARFLQKISDAYAKNDTLPNLLLDTYFSERIESAHRNWRKVVALSAENGIAIPAFMSALSYYDSYRSERLPANLLQAQRDYFGAHTYERVDQPRGKFFHLDWPDPKRPQQEIGK